MQCKIEAIAALTLEPNEDKTGSTLTRTEFALELSDNMIRSEYLDKDGQPTKLGIHAITSCFIQGLVGSIHYAHQNGMRDSAEHLRYIIKDLERGFVRPVEIEHGKFKPLHS